MCAPAPPPPAGGGGRRGGTGRDTPPPPRLASLSGWLESTILTTRERRLLQGGKGTSGLCNDTCKRTMHVAYPPSRRASACALQMGRRAVQGIQGIKFVHKGGQKCGVGTHKARHRQLQQQEVVAVAGRKAQACAHHQHAATSWRVAAAAVSNTAMLLRHRLAAAAVGSAAMWIAATWQRRLSGASPCGLPPPGSGGCRRGSGASDSSVGVVLASMAVVSVLHGGGASPFLPGWAAGLVRGDGRGGHTKDADRWRQVRLMAV